MATCSPLDVVDNGVCGVARVTQIEAELTIGSGDNADRGGDIDGRDDSGEVRYGSDPKLYRHLLAGL